MIVKCAILTGIFDSLKVLFGDRRKAVLCIIAFLSFMDMAIFSKGSFNARVVLNCLGLVYLRAV